MHHRTPVLLLVLSTAACFAEPARPGGGGQPIEPPLEPIKIVFAPNSGAGQVAPVASYLPNLLVAQVVQGDTPVPGVAIRWHAVNAAARVEPLNDVSDANGFVSARYFMGEASGEQSAIAFLGNQWLGFRVTATPGAPASLKRITPFSDSMQAFFPLFLKLRVEDRYGNGVPGVHVAWTADGKNTYLQGYTPSGSDGIDSSFVVFDVVPRTTTVTASVPQIPSITPVTFQPRGTP